MDKDRVFERLNPIKNIVEDSLSEFIRLSAQKMLRVAIESEVKELALLQSLKIVVSLVCFLRKLSILGTIYSS